MPQYTFKCSECGTSVERVLRMSESDDPQVCPRCTSIVPMHRDYQADMCNVGNKEYATPIHSDSLAISPEQVTEHQRLFPDVKLDSECRPILENYQQHNNYLEKTGFIKQRQKPKKRGKTFKQEVAK